MEKTSLVSSAARKGTSRETVVGKARMKRVKRDLGSAGLVEKRDTNRDIVQGSWNGRNG